MPNAGEGEIDTSGCGGVVCDLSVATKSVKVSWIVETVFSSDLSRLPT